MKMINQIYKLNSIYNFSFFSYSQVVHNKKQVRFQYQSQSRYKFQMAVQPHYNTHYLHSIIDENQELRMRLSKLSQIESYVQALLSKCQHIENQKDQLLHDNQLILANQKILETEYYSMQNRHAQQIRMVVLEHDSIMKRMHRELTIIKDQTQRQIKANQDLKLAKIKLQEEVQELSHRVHIQQLEFEKEVANLRSDCMNAQKQYKSLANEYEQLKSEHLVEKEELIQQIYNLKAITIRQQNRYIQQLQSENTALIKQNKGLKSYNQQISRNSAKRENEIRQSTSLALSESQFRQNLLKKQLNALQDELTDRKDELQRIKMDSNMLIDQNIQNKRDLQNSCANSDRLCFLLQQSDKQNLNLREKLKQLDKYIQTQTQQYKNQFFDQRDHNSELRKVLNEKQITLNEKLREIKDLLNITDEMEANIKLKEKQLKLLSTQLQQSYQKISFLSKQNEQKTYHIKNLEQKNKRQRLAIDDTQISNNLLKKQVMELQSANHMLKRQLNNPRIAGKEIEQKIQNMNKIYLSQKQKLVRDHSLQKQKIRNTHQLQLRQKQLQYLRKIEHFQIQLERLKK